MAGGRFLDRFGEVRRALTALAQQSYAAAGIGTTQAKLVRIIGQRSPISPAELARASGTDPTLTGRALAPLLKRGLVRRARKDGRAYALELGPKGKRVARLLEELRAELSARILAVLDERDRADFDRIAAKILAAFENDAAR